MSANDATPTVFIDGQQGSTGLRITSLLADRDDLRLITIEESKRKDLEARRACLEAADVAVLCLPDAAADEALALIEHTDTRVIDTSSSRRIDPSWVYGLPELSSEQRERVRSGRRVANPGCYPQTFILALRPLIEAGKLDPSLPFTVNAVSGYSGGGRKLVETYRAHAPRESGDAGLPFCLYGLAGGHKHLPEMQRYALVEAPPLFVPSVAPAMCGMLVSIPLPAPWLNGLDREQVHALWAARYGNEPFVNAIAPATSDDALRDGAFLDLEGASYSNRLDLMVFGSNDGGLVLVGRLDNLGKGASGNAAQCLNLMLGLPETAGLEVGARDRAA